MKKRELLAKIEALEKRIEILEARPSWQIWPTIATPYTAPPYPSDTQITWGTPNGTSGQGTFDNATLSVENLQ